MDYLQRPRPRRQSVTEWLRGSPTPATWLFLALNIVMFLVVEATGGTEGREGLDNLIRWGAKVGRNIADGEYWRLFTPMFLHIGFAHLITNSLGLLIFGRLVERYFGTLNFIVIYLLAGVFGNIASYAVLTGGVGAGASGAVFGIVAAYAAFLYKNRGAAGSLARSSLGGLALIIGINLVFGFSVSGIDNWAHIGGLAAGFAVALRLVPRAVFLPYDPLSEPFETIRRPVLVRPSRLALIEVLVVSGLTIVATTWVIGAEYPLR